MSFENIKAKWIPEIEHHCPGTIKFVCGLKTDLRNNDDTLERLRRFGQTPVTTAQGESMAKAVGAAGYLECSALTQDGLKVRV